MYKLRIYILNYEDDLKSINLSQLCGIVIKDKLEQSHKHLQVASLDIINGQQDISTSVRELLTLELNIIKVTIFISQSKSSNPVFNMLTNSCSNNICAHIKITDHTPYTATKSWLKGFLEPLITQFNEHLNKRKVPLLRQFETYIETKDFFTISCGTETAPQIQIRTPSSKNKKYKEQKCPPSPTTKTI